MLCALALITAAPMAGARDQVLAVGSSTVYPFATVVAEHIGKTTDFKTPQVEAWGSGGGIKFFCRGVGVGEADIALASREMVASELQQCQENGVSDILGLRFGWDGIILATAGKGPHLRLTLKDLFLALGRRIPDPNGEEQLVPNPYKSWKETNPTLPDVPIQVYGPPVTSGTRDVLVERGLIRGCKSFDWLSALSQSDPERFRQVCGAIREDGAYTSTGENDNLIVRKVGESDQAVGIFGFSYYDQNRDKLQASEIEGIEPTFDTIYSRDYPLARPLYIYVKAAHADSIPGLEPFLSELMDERASGEEGYLIDRGLIPVPAPERKANAEKIRELVEKRQ